MEILASLLLLIGFIPLQKTDLSGGLLIDPTRPSAYISYEHFGKRKPVRSGESDDGVWLSLHNNTTGALSLYTESLYLSSAVTPLKLKNGNSVLGFKNNVEVLVWYEVERRYPSDAQAPGVLEIKTWNPYQRLSSGSGGEGRSISWIPSGGTIIFSLPKEHLLPNHRIAVPYMFEWELNSHNESHMVYFYESDLPR